MSTKSKKIVAEAMIAAALGLSAFGLGAGVANAKPHGPGIPWIPGPGPGHGDWEDGGDGAWYGPGYGPYLGPIQACVSATGPWGYVTGTACI